MQPHEKTAQWKATAGYLLLTILLLIGLVAAWKALSTLTNPDPAEARLDQRRHATYKLASLLQQTEALATLISTGDATTYADYRRLNNETIDSLQALSNYLDAPAQKQRLDTLSWLLQRKRKAVESLMRLNGQDVTRLYEEQLRKLAEKSVSMPEPHIQRRIVTKAETQTKPNEKRSFFRRLGDLFNPNRADSSQVKITHHEEIVDTLFNNITPADTVSGILRNVEAELQNSLQEHAEKRRLRSGRLRRQAAETSNRLASLFTDFQMEERRLITQREAQTYTLRRKASFFLGTLAACSLLLAGGFIWAIRREFARSRHYRLELEKANQQAKDLLDVREKLMLAITHDIKAPVGTMLGYTDLLLNRPECDARSRTYLDNIRTSGNHLLALVRSLLDFHKLDAHKMETTPVPFNPAQLFQTIHDAFKPQADVQGIQLIYHPGQQLDKRYTGDALRIRQIADNLLSNAFKFTKTGSITLRTAYTGTSLLLTVTDTGCGIAETEKENLFKEFTRLSNAQGAEGFGLGLAVTHKLVTLLGGTISVDSQLGKGTTFRVAIPLPEAASPSPTPQPQLPSSKDRIIRLYILDDDRLQSELTERLLKHPYLDITTGNNPNEALPLLCSAQFDVLLTDIQMPGMNGFDLVAQLRKAEENGTHHTLVLALTARDDLQTDELIRHGFDGCLHKPFTRESVYQLIGLSGASPSAPQSSVPPSWTNLLAFAVGDKVAERELLLTFITENKKNITAMRNALQVKDGAVLAGVAHKARPTYELLGKHQTEALLRNIDQQRNQTVATSDMCNDARQAIADMEVTTQEAIDYMNS